MRRAPHLECPPVPAPTRRAIARLLLAASALLGTALACNDHELQPFSSSVTAGLQQRGPAWTRPVDVLFVIDDSRSMCEEQATLQRNFERFVGIMNEANADFRLAVVTTDMVTIGQGGTLRTQPGDFSGGTGCDVMIDEEALAACPEQLPRFLDIGDYGDGVVAAELDRLRRDFGCLAMAGTSGNPVEMGLGALELALTRDAELPAQQRFVRDDALLAVVVVSDENDCTDGTLGAAHGPVYRQTVADRDDGSACELQRNIEDSCLYGPDDPGPQLEHAGESRSAFEWCVGGEREAVEALADRIAPDCPEGGCRNALVSRREIFDRLVELKGSPDEILFAAIINADGGVRYDTAAAIEPWCGVGQQGYRYDLMARMFDPQAPILGPICDLANGQPLDFADRLERIAEAIVDELSGVCLQALPEACVDGICPDDVYVEVTVRSGDEETALVNGEGFRLQGMVPRCAEETGVPYKIEFIDRVPRPDDEIEVSFARTVGSEVP